MIYSLALVVVSLCAAVLTVSGQDGPATRYFSRYHSETDNSVRVACQTQAEGVAIAGVIADPDWEIRLLMVDSAGTAYSTRTFSRQGYNLEPGSMVATSDGGLMIAAAAVRHGGTEPVSVWIIRTDQFGDTLWTCPLRPSLLASTLYVGLLAPADSSDLFLFIETADDFNYRYVHRVTISEFGDSLSSDSMDYFSYGSIYRATESENYITTWGRTTNTVRVGRLSNEFQPVWSSRVTYAPIYNDYFPLNGCVTHEGKVAICGRLGDDTLGVAAGLYLISEVGDSMWLFIHEWSTLVPEFSGVVEGPDGNLVCAGYTCCESPPYLVKVDLAGHEVWTQYYGDSLNHEQAVGIFANRDGSYTVAGWSSPNNMRRIRPFVLRTEPDGLAANEPISHPTNFSLSQNFPNPFNPTTEISFTLANETEITLRVYDLLGREVAVLLSGRFAAGEHRAVFDGSRLTSGVYFYRLEAGGVVETRKMLLLK